MYYSNKTYTDSSTGTVAADLDYDDTSSYGPEITTIHMFTEGDYYFYVHNFSNGSSSTSTVLAQSGATVKVYVNSSLEKIYTVDEDSAGTYWNVFKLTISGSGSLSFEELNEYSSSATVS
ncbi:MAG: hypothetical protein LUF92_09845 [Clostridiales bacterium]|nr:hypothetical protein [Clostridiales bacterium]